MLSCRFLEVRLPLPCASSRLKLASRLPTWLRPSPTTPSGDWHSWILPRATLLPLRFGDQGLLSLSEKAFYTCRLWLDNPARRHERRRAYYNLPRLAHH